MSDKPLKFGEAGPEIQRLREENQHLRGAKEGIREQWAELLKDNAAKAAEITRLRAELATARREGMGASADLCDDLPDHQGGICAIAIRMMIDEEDKKAAIRAAAGEGK